MPPPRRKVQATLESTLTPPTHLEPGQLIARTVGAAGNNLYHVTLPASSNTSEEQNHQQQGESRTILVELAPQFRSTVWLKRGGYVLVDLKAASTTGNLAARENKIDGEIINVVGDERAWRKAAWWPKEFVKGAKIPGDSADRNGENDEDEEESRVGKMPPGSSDEEG